VSLNVHSKYNFLNINKMIKKILELTGAQQLSKKEQNAINGGCGGLCIDECYGGGPCGENESCVTFMCFADPCRPLYGLCISNGGNQ
jgi:hypothetical protein